jgi:hypothetical protein
MENTLWQRAGAAQEHSAIPLAPSQVCRLTMYRRLASGTLANTGSGVGKVQCGPRVIHAPIYTRSKEFHLRAVGTEVYGRAIEWRH